MTFWQAALAILVVGAAIGLVYYLIPKGIGYLFEKRGIPHVADDVRIGLVLLSGFAVLAGIVSCIATAPPGNDNEGRCGPGTRQVVERVWTGKVYVTEPVCVVDPPK